MSSTNSEWNISTDIYNIVQSVDNLKKRYINDEDETTLSLGIFGYLGDTESKKIQTATIMTGQLGNEMFPARAKLTKNVLTHAIYNNITDINAVPATMVINLGIKLEDFEAHKDGNDEFVFDSDCPLFIGDYEFHFDYDIILQRSGTNGNVFSAHYDMTVENPISTIKNPYLKQPFLIVIGNYQYIIFQATVRQVTIEVTEDKILSDSVIENKTYNFTFANQLADFVVYCTDNGVETKLTPALYGSSTEGIDRYCWYLYLSDDTVRISFDSKSYVPGLNTDIKIRAYTTLGADGEFSYKKVDESEEGLFVDIESTKYDYNKITCYLVAGTDCVEGSNRKSKAELQKLIPKAAFSRGSITTSTDINNYFNLINTEQNRLMMREKVDNQFGRTWYGFFVLKDVNNDIIPTNTVAMKICTKDGSMYLGEDGRYVLPAGTIISYNNESKLATVIDEVDVPDLYSADYFSNNYYYMTVYNLVLNPDPLYAAFYLTICDKDSFFTFNWVNEDCFMQFVANRCNFKRNLLTDQSTYKFTFKIAQSILHDYGLYAEDEIIVKNPSTGEEIRNVVTTNNMKCILVLYKDDTPYRWVEAELTDYDQSKFISSWEVDLRTDNGLDDQNRLKILDLNVATKADVKSYGYFDSTTKVSMYILSKFTQGSYGRYDLDDIAPGFEDYTVTNIYDVDDGITFFENFTNVLDTRVYTTPEPNTFTVSGVPVVGLHYMTEEERATYLVDAIYERKAYIGYCIELLENGMYVDFKFFNTYGPALTYTMGDKEETAIGHVDLQMKFRAKLKNSSDVYAKDDLIAAIKEYVEDIEDTGTWHAPNMIAELMNQLGSRFEFIEFMNYNNNRLGIQHIEEREIDSPHIVPEFLNIRNRYNEVEDKLEPWIDVEIVS